MSSCASAAADFKMTVVTALLGSCLLPLFHTASLVDDELMMTQLLTLEESAREC